LDSFKQWFNGDLGGKTSIKLLTKSKAEQGKKDPKLLYIQNYLLFSVYWAL
jgi:hypothetical protein